jgi:hypothetical protein
MEVESFLSFPEITSEAQEHYKDLTKLKKFNTKQKSQFFKERKLTLEKFLELILNTDFPNLADTQVHYSLFGPFFELLVKLCLLKENWKDYLSIYLEGKNKRNFGYAKSQLLNKLKNKKLNEKQLLRVKETLDFVQVQRNNFLHSPFKGYDHYATQAQFFELIVILDYLFVLKLSDDLLFEMLNKAYSYKRNNSGFDFEEVFEDLIKKIYLGLKLRDKELDELIEQKYDNITSTFFEHDDGTFLPKQIVPVEVGFIQYPEPHIIITDWYEEPQDWYPLYTLIGDFAEQSFLCYQKGYYYASIACSINCCEYILKYEYLRRIKRKDAKDFIKTATLGSFTGDNEKNLIKLKIKNKFSRKLKILNKIRRALYHYNPKEVKELQKLGKTFIEKTANPITDHLLISMTAYKAYNVMKELVEHFYNEKTRIKFIKEGLKDYEKKKELAAKEIHQNQFGGLPPVSKGLIEGYMKKKNDFIKKEYLNKKNGI